MNYLTPAHLQILLDADAIKSVTVRAVGNAFYIGIVTKKSEEFVLSKGRGIKDPSRPEKTYATLPSLFKFLREIGIGQFTVDIANWTPDQPALPATQTKTTKKKGVKK